MLVELYAVIITVYLKLSSFVLFERAALLLGQIMKYDDVEHLDLSLSPFLLVLFSSRCGLRQCRSTITKELLVVKV